MNARLLAVSALSLAPLLVAGTASAQAPGEQVEPAEAAEAVDAVDAIEVAPVAPMVVAPAMVPVAAAPACECGVVRAARAPLMANRWSIGLSVGGMSLKPDGATDSTSFGVGELAVRFRATPHLELELSAGGGREQLDNGMQGDLEVATFAGAVRYRFNPYGAWNWFVMGGLGAASVTFHDATDQERQDATHPMAMVGVGVERRFNRFALQAELRGVGVADKKTDHEMAAVSMPGAPPTTDAASVKQSGAEFTVGASWYF